MATALQEIHLPHLPESLAVYVALYTDLKNGEFLRQQLLAGNADFEYAMIDASMVVSQKHALTAIFRAANDYLYGRLKSRNVHSEIVFSFSANNNIAESFRKFGITSKTKSLLIVKLSTEPSVTYASVSAHLAANVEGTAIAFSDESFTKLADMNKIKRVYKLNGSGGNNKKKEKGSNAVTGAANACSVLEIERNEIEVVVIGMMALRGAT